MKLESGEGKTQRLEAIPLCYSSARFVISTVGCPFLWEWLTQIHGSGGREDSPMAPQTDPLKSTAPFTDAQTVPVDEAFEPELGPTPSPQHWKTPQG